MSGANNPGGAEALLWSDTLTAAASANVKTTQTTAPGSGPAVGGKLWSWKGSSASAACYLLFFDAASTAALVSGTTTPLFAGIALGVGSTTPLAFADSFSRGRSFKTGLCWATSTTPGVFTTSAATIVFSVEYT